MISSLLRSQITSYFLFFFLVSLLVLSSLNLYYEINDDSSFFTNSKNEIVNYGSDFRVKYYNTSGFDLKRSYGTYIKEALNFWNSVIDERDTVIEIDVQSNYDRDTRLLAKASANDYTDIRKGGEIIINVAANPKSWTDVFKHEIGHILGIGSNRLWENSVFTQNEKKYLDGSIFSETLEIYKNDYGGREDHIPLDSTGSHFSEEIFTTELMTPYSNEGFRQPVTNLTFSALEKLGWIVDHSKVEVKN